MDRKKDWGGGKMRRVQSGGRDGQKKKKKDWGGGKNEKGRKWRERWTKKKAGEGER